MYSFELSKPHKYFKKQIESLELLRRLNTYRLLLAELGFSSLVSDIISLKRGLIDPEAAAKNAKTDREKKIAVVYRIYQEKLVKNNTCDINDLVRLTIKLFKKSPQVLDFYRNKYKMIIIDDYHYSNYLLYFQVLYSS